MPRVQIIRSYDHNSSNTTYDHNSFCNPYFPSGAQQDPYYGKYMVGFESFMNGGAYQPQSGQQMNNGPAPQKPQPQASNGMEDDSKQLMADFFKRRNDDIFTSIRGDVGPPRTVQYLATNEKPKPSFETKHHEQKFSGKLYEDPDFPTTNKSIYPTRSHGPSIQWKRPKDLCRSPRFISDGVSRFDVRQGELGDCWLLAAIASMSCDDSIFNKVVVQGQDFDESYCGMFRFRLWRFGNWVDVVVDDRLPVRNNKLMFMHSTDKNEFWSALLEKAFAKLCGSYEALSGGNQSEAMEDFTGGLCETVELGRANRVDLLKIMKQASISHAMMGCSIETDDGEIEGRRSDGLITGHAYSITGIKTVRLVSGAEANLVRVRNPWGNETEWRGDWSDNSDSWNLVSADVKREMAFANADDGEFWMCFDDFAEQFTKLEICFIGPELMGVVQTDDPHGRRRWEECIEVGSWKARVSAGGCRNFIDSFHTNPQFRIEIVDPDEDDDENLGTIIVGLMQKDMRKKNMGEYLTIGYSIYRLKDPNCGTLDQKFFRYSQSVDKSQYVNQREICKRHKLPPGHYAIIPSTFEPNEEADFILRIYSEKPNTSAAIDNPCVMQDMVTKVYGKKAFNKVMENEEPLRKAFDAFAGPSGKIHARQLQKILNNTFTKEIRHFEGFSYESCRSFLSLVDANMSGYMEFEEFTLLWNEICLLRKIFTEHDEDRNGSFDCFELRSALTACGYQLSNQVFEALAMRYTDHEKSCILFEDFILLAVRLKIAFESFTAAPKTEEGYGVIQQNHFLLQTLYL